MTDGSRDLPATIPDGEDELEESRAPLLDHLIELRKRVIISLAAVAIGFIISFLLSKPIYEVLIGPFQEAALRVRGDEASRLELIFTEPLEYFFVQLRLGLFGAIILAFPVIAYQTYAFVAPGLYKTERKAFLPYLFASPVLFAAGSALVYFFVLPFVMQFALNQEQTGEAFDIKLLPKVSDYLTLVTTLILAFGFSFQMPVVLTLMARVELISAETLRAWRKYAIVGIFAFAAFVTPPDPLSQIGLGFALIGLYELSIWCVRWVERTRERDEEAAAGAAAE